MSFRLPRKFLSVLAVVALLITLYRLSTQRVAEAGCVNEGDKTVVRFERDCLGTNSSSGEFRFATRTVHKCTAKKKSIFDSESSEITLFVGVSEIAPNLTESDTQKIIITITPPKNEELKDYNCGTSKLTPQITKLLELKNSGSLSSSHFSKISDSFHEIKNIPRTTLDIHIDEDGKPKVSRLPKKQYSPDEKYNVYYRTDALGNVFTRIQCSSWSPSCVVFHASVVNGRFNSYSLFPSEYESHAFEISDGIAAFLEKSYQFSDRSEK